MQAPHRLAQIDDRRRDDLVRPRHLADPARRRLHQLLVRGQQALEGLVVEELGRGAAGRLLGLEHRAHKRLEVRLASARARQRIPRYAQSAARMATATASATTTTLLDSPRRMPSATAAARSETPSFS